MPACCWVTLKRYPTSDILHFNPILKDLFELKRTYPYPCANACRCPCPFRCSCPCLFSCSCPCFLNMKMDVDMELKINVDMRMIMDMDTDTDMNTDKDTDMTLDAKIRVVVKSLIRYRLYCLPCSVWYQRFRRRYIQYIVHTYRVRSCMLNFTIGIPLYPHINHWTAWLINANLIICFIRSVKKNNLQNLSGARTI